MQKNVLIVGASSGLGRRLAELYAGEGAKVGLIARREELLREISRSFPSNIFFRQADISEPGAENIFKNLVDEMDGVDVVIITASIVLFNEDLSSEDELTTVETNARGFTRIANAAYNYFKKKGAGQIVGVTSIAAARGNRHAPAYNASKAFQASYLEGLRVKAGKENKNIRITELVPGYIKTDMGRGDRLFWVASIEKAARQSKKAIDKKRKKVFITKRWWLVYHVLRFLPIFIYDGVVNGKWKLKQQS
jgi:short-subunit dehydrogenase